jgi:transposase
MDRRDGLDILRFLLEDRLLRIWIPLPAERDVRQLLRRRQRRVYLRSSVKNQLQILAMGQGIRRIFRLNNLEARQ